MEGQKVLLEKTGSQLGEQELPDFQPQTPRRHPREETSQAGSQDQPSPRHWEKSLLLQEPTSRLAETGKHSVCLLSLSSALHLYQSISGF